MHTSWRRFFIRAIIVPCGLMPLAGQAADKAGGPPPVAVDTSNDNSPPTLLPQAEAPVATEPAKAEPTPAQSVSLAPEGLPHSEPTPAAPRAAAAAPTPSNEIRPAAFQDITPGKTTTDELTQKLGQPAEITRATGTEIYVYHPADFARVEVVVADGLARSLVVHLKGPTSPADLIQDLSFQAFAPARVCDADGREIGMAFPERGVMFAFVADATTPLVGQIVLETVSAEAFLVRAEQPGTRNYTQTLADLDAAEKLGAPAARVHVRRAEVLTAMGQTTAALASAEEALKSDSDLPRALLAKARILGEQGQFELAQKEAGAAIASPAATWQWKARGECALGDLVGAGPDRNFDSALEHHRAAVKLATPFIGDAHPATRRDAKEILAQAHLAIAHDIASGDWRNKKEAVPKWLRKGGELVEDFLKSEGGDNVLRLDLYCAVVQAYSASGDLFDPSAAADQALKEGHLLLSSSNDPAFQHVLEWKLGNCLAEAARLHRDRAQTEAALKMADSAAAFVASAAKSREVSPARDYALAKLFYIIGSIHAIDRNDHAEAVAFYDKALGLIADPLPQAIAARQGEHGEMLVSMGVSYWEAGQREKSVSLTESGVRNIRRAIDLGTFKAEALAVPYGNLANMHEQLGHAEQAKRYADLSGHNAPAASTAAKPAPEGGLRR